MLHGSRSMVAIRPGNPDHLLNRNWAPSNAIKITHHGDQCLANTSTSGATPESHRGRASKCCGTSITLSAPCSGGCSINWMSCILTYMNDTHQITTSMHNDLYKSLGAWAGH